MYLRVYFWTFYNPLYKTYWSAVLLILIMFWTTSKPVNKDDYIQQNNYRPQRICER